MSSMERSRCDHALPGGCDKIIGLFFVGVGRGHAVQWTEPQRVVILRMEAWLLRHFTSASRRSAGGKIVSLREYFDPVRAAMALDTPILGLQR